MSTPTPRTDSEEYPEGEGQSFHVVSADFARTLETELAALTAERDQLRAEVKSCGELSCDECNARTAALTTERDQLRATIAEMPTCRCGLSTDDQCELTAKLGAATTERDSIKQEIELVEHRVYRAEAECMEQARLLGKSGEREADLLGKMERIERKLATITAERDQLRNRAELAEDNLAALEQSFDDNCRGVVRIDAELAKERARLDWLESSAATELQSERGWIDRAAIDAAMKEHAK